MIAIGIDIGLTGAVAFVDHNSRCSVFDMPVLPDGEKGKRIDGRALARLLRANAPPTESVVVLFEDVRPRSFGNGGEQTNSMHSQGSMMRTRGAIEAVLDVLGVTAEALQPQTWKRFYGLNGVGKDLRTQSQRDSAKKHASREVALALYPEAPLHLVKHHNRAEAVLIAHYGLREMT